MTSAGCGKIEKEVLNWIKNLNASEKIFTSANTGIATGSGQRSTMRVYLQAEKKRRLFPLGSDLTEARDKLKKLEAQDIDCHDFDLDRIRTAADKPRDGKSEAFTFSEWAEHYPLFDDVKRKRLLPTDLTLIRVHLKPFFGSMLLTEITREALCRYIDTLGVATLVRGKKGQSKKTVSRGTISNEPSLLRRMRRVAAREGFKVIVPSFEALIIRTERGGRALTDDEQTKLLAIYALWMRRLSEFAAETCLSEGDLLRLTDD